MPKRAKVYIHLVSALGVLALAIGFWSPPWPHDPLRFCMYFLLSLLAAALKLRLPGMTGTMSIGFVFVLLGIAELSLPETMLIACAGTVLQCFWRAARRPGAMQVVFNVAAVAISVVLAYQPAHFVQARWHTNSVAVLMALATCIYFVASSLLVSGVLSRVEGRPLREVWERCSLLSFPYYLLGGVVAGLIAASSREAGWQLPLLILPVMGGAFLFCRMYFARLMAPVAVEVHAPRCACR
jgi:hypothetical protein